MFMAMNNRPVQGMNGHRLFGSSHEDFNGSSTRTRMNSNGTADGRSGRFGGRGRVRFEDVPDDITSRRSLWDSLVFVATTILMLVCVTGLMTIVGVLYLTVRPFSLSVYRRLAAQLGMASFLDALAILLPDTKILLTGDSDMPSSVGTSLMLSNHVVDADWWAMFMLARCTGLRGTLKPFLRNEYLRISLQNPEEATAASSTGRSSLALVASSSSGTSRVVSTATTRTETTTSGSASSSSPTSSNSPSTNNNNNKNGSPRQYASWDISFLAQILNRALEFPLLSGEDHPTERGQLFLLLRSFAENNNGASAPVHLLFYPESWSIHNGADRKSIHAKSNEFAKREGRPQLKHLLLPRTRAFKASLECLRESSPLVYDVTMAYTGYDGSLPLFRDLSLFTLWKFLQCDFPREIHLRIKRYTMEEVLQDPGWLDRKWAEKDRLLAHFARHQYFPVDSRSYNRPRVFNTRQYSVESSTVALVRLLLLPCAVPVLVFLSIPLFWTLLSIWLAHRAFLIVFPDPNAPHTSQGSQHSSSDGAPATPVSTSAPNTPHCPATPFGSPSGEMFSGSRS